MARATARLLGSMAPMPRGWRNQWRKNSAPEPACASGFAGIATQPVCSRLRSHHHIDKPVRAPGLLHLPQRGAKDFRRMRVRNSDYQRSSLGRCAHGRRTEPVHGEHGQGNGIDGRLPGAAWPLSSAAWPRRADEMLPALPYGGLEALMSLGELLHPVLGFVPHAEACLATVDDSFAPLSRLARDKELEGNELRLRGCIRLILNTNIFL
jgi:hypothetical protein